MQMYLRAVFGNIGSSLGFDVVQGFSYGPLV